MKLSAFFRIRSRHQVGSRARNQVEDILVWLCVPGFVDNLISAVHLIMPWTPVPMVISREVQNSRAGNIESDVPVFSNLIKKMAGICPLIPTAPVIGAAHKSASTDAFIGPAL